MIIHPNHPWIQYSGRVDVSDQMTARFDWPLTGVTAAFEGKGIGFLLEDGKNNYDVYVDGQLFGVWVTSSAIEEYEVTGLKRGRHVLQVIKRTESSWGTAIFKGLVLPKGTVLAEPPNPSERRIEIIGDSISAGYGNEGSNFLCADLRPFQNANQAYGAMLARRFAADCHVEAISGKGLVRNWGDFKKVSPDPMPIYLSNTLGLYPGVPWNFNSWIPDVVILFLGTNDFSTNPKPDPDFFVLAYEKLIQKIRGHYPKAWILCLGRKDMPDMASAVWDAVHREKKIGNIRLRYISIQPFNAADMGCDGHPKVADHKRLADHLTPFIARLLKWRKAPALSRRHSSKKTPLKV